MKIDQWDRIKSTEINCYAVGQLILASVPRQFQWGKAVLKRLFTKEKASHKQKSKAGSQFHLHSKFNSKGSETQLNMTPKMVKLLEENKGINLVNIDR